MIYLKLKKTLLFKILNIMKVLWKSYYRSNIFYIANNINMWINLRNVRRKTRQNGAFSCTFTSSSRNTVTIKCIISQRL